LEITIQYFEGCPHWAIAVQRVHRVLDELSVAEVHVDHELIQSPEHAARVGFRGSPTILVNGRDPFATGAEAVGMACRVYVSDQGRQGSPTESQIRAVLSLEVSGRPGDVRPTGSA